MTRQLGSFSELEVKAGIFGRSLKETVGTVAETVARTYGVEVVDNGFRCPPNRANGGTFTDAMGTTCGIFLAVDAFVDAVEGIADAAEIPTTGRAGGKAAAIRERGQGVLRRIKEAGGMPFRVTDDFVRDHSEDRFLGRLSTHDEKYAEQREKVVGALRFAREFLSGKTEEKRRNTKVLENLHPDVRDMILNMSDDELVEALTEQAVEFHKGLDRRVRINIPSANIDGLLEAGRYLTTHETQSKHSGPDMRTVIELNMGFPRELDPTLRPASGYVVHPDWTADAVAAHARLKGRDVVPSSGPAYKSPLTASSAMSSSDEVERAVAEFDALPDDALVTVFHGTTASNARVIEDSGVSGWSPRGDDVSRATELQGMYVAMTREDASMYTGRDGGEVVEVVVPKASLVVSPEMGGPDRVLPGGKRMTTGYALYNPSGGAVIPAGQKLTSVNGKPKTDSPDPFVDTHEDISSRFFGPVGIYGDAELILHPAVAERTGYGRGDSLNTHLRPAGIDETDPELIFNAVFSFDQKDSHEDLDTVLSFLESRRTGSFAKVNAGDGGTPVEKVFGGEAVRTYYEALIPGSVTLDEIEAIRVGYAELANPPGRVGSQFHDGTHARERTEAIRAEFFNPEMLQRMGFNEEEIQYILGMLDNYTPSNRNDLGIPRQLMNKAIKDLLAFRSAAENKKKIEDKGIKVVATDHRGLDLFDAGNYRGGNTGDDVEQLLFARVVEGLATEFRAERQRAADYARRRAAGEDMGIM